uniref:Transmembrane protein n=1 Tax=Heterorhabditis bacteriophora TaxID=37862 RepID=A0A1I7XEB2_HETBA
MDSIITPQRSLRAVIRGSINTLDCLHSNLEPPVVSLVIVVLHVNKTYIMNTGVLDRGAWLGGAGWGPSSLGGGPSSHSRGMGGSVFNVQGGHGESGFNIGQERNARTSFFIQKIVYIHYMRQDLLRVVRAFQDIRYPYIFSITCNFSGWCQFWVPVCFARIYALGMRRNANYQRQFGTYGFIIMYE